MIIEFLDALPDGAVFATVPCGQSDCTGVGSTFTPNPAPLSTAVAASTGWHFTLGTPTRCPYAIFSVGRVKLTTGLPAIASCSVCWTA